MSKRRMFSKQITDTDDFLDMPLSSHALYFHLGMQADDDGFVSPKKVMRMIQAKEDDLNILVFKKFVIQFDDGVIVITHRKTNNQIRKDRYTATLHQEKLKILSYKDGKYGLLQALQPNGNQMATSGCPSIGKESIGKDIEEKKYFSELEEYVKGRNSTVFRGDIKQLPKTKKINEYIKSSWKKLRQSYSLEEIKEGTRKYFEDCCNRGVSKDPKAYCNHRFSIQKFLKQSNGFEEFFNS